MSYRKFDFVEGEFYHIYNRGNSKQKIFYDEMDYKRFINLLYISNGKNPFKLLFIKDPYQFDRGEQLVSVGAYCLMPNHFHLLVTQQTENGISEFMKKVSTGYSMYFNKKYERSGVLFEGRFKAQIATEDRYLKYLFSYIHLNPVKLIQEDWKKHGVHDSKATRQHLETYSYSSLPFYLGKDRKENLVINNEAFPQYFLKRKDVVSELMEWLRAENKQDGPV